MLFSTRAAEKREPPPTPRKEVRPSLLQHPRHPGREGYPGYPRVPVHPRERRVVEPLAGQDRFFLGVEQGLPPHHDVHGRPAGLGLLLPPVRLLERARLGPAGADNPAGLLPLAEQEHPVALGDALVIPAAPVGDAEPLPLDLGDPLGEVLPPPLPGAPRQEVGAHHNKCRGHRPWRLAGAARRRTGCPAASASTLLHAGERLMVTAGGLLCA